MHNTFDYIHLLCGGIKQDSRGRWISTDLSGEDMTRFGAPGGKLRVLASALLATRHSQTMIFTGGGKGYGVPSGTTEARPLLAHILRDELSDAGVPLEKIILEEESNNTYQEFIELSRFTEEHPGKTFSVVTNRWHIPRTQTILEFKFPSLIEHAKVEFVAAEDVLLENDPSLWSDVIETAYASDWMKQLAEIEEKGRQQILEGTYKFR